MPKDILLDENFDLLVVNGDFVIGESTIQHQKLLLLAEKGEFKESPKTGVGKSRFIEDHTPENFAREIREEFTKDGMKVEQIIIEPYLKVIANYITT